MRTLSDQLSTGIDQPVRNFVDALVVVLEKLGLAPVVDRSCAGCVMPIERLEEELAVSFLACGP
jgi:predicted  nucleic acid-binding Zn-ribbon protein